MILHFEAQKEAILLCLALTIYIKRNDSAEMLTDKDGPEFLFSGFSMGNYSDRGGYWSRTTSGANYA